MIGKYVIVRGKEAGIFAGILKEFTGNGIVTLTDCRRLWYWDGAASISQLAATGTSKPDSCKFTVTVNEIAILGVIEVIPCTKLAENSIRGVREWKR